MCVPKNQHVFASTTAPQSRPPQCSFGSPALIRVLAAVFKCFFFPHGTLFCRKRAMYSIDCCCPAQQARATLLLSYESMPAYSSRSSLRCHTVYRYCAVTQNDLSPRLDPAMSTRSVHAWLTFLFSCRSSCSCLHLLRRWP